MKEIRCFIKAECRKMKRTYLPLLYLGIPLLGCFIFLLYYRSSSWTVKDEIAAYGEGMGIALPFLISVLSAISVELEEKNHFQVFLGIAGKKRNALLGKYIALLFCTLGAFVIAVGVFGAGFTIWLGKEDIPVILWFQLIFVLWLSSAILYLIHMFLNLKFPKFVSMAVGIGESLVSAILLTGLGERIWMFIPASWGTRWAMYTTGISLDNRFRELVYASGYLKRCAFICMLITGLFCAIIFIWFQFYEGRQVDD